jgi:hypothetical protein
MSLRRGLCYRSEPCLVRSVLLVFIVSLHRNPCDDSVAKPIDSTPAINLLRTRLQASGSSGHPQIYTGFWDVTQQTLKREGWVGLYKGLLPTLAKVAPAVSISYVVSTWTGFYHSPDLTCLSVLPIRFTSIRSEYYISDEVVVQGGESIIRPSR